MVVVSDVAYVNNINNYLFLVFYIYIMRTCARAHTLNINIRKVVWIYNMYMYTVTQCMYI